MKKFLLLSAVVFLISSCTTTSVIQVSRVGEEPEEYIQRAVYALPQTLLNISVHFEKETYIPGPYRLYTQKYLGLEDYISETGFSYRILNVEVSAITEPDPDHYYSINVIKGEFDWGKYLDLSGHGLILNPFASFTHEQDDYAREIPSVPPYFTDRSVKRNLLETTDTLYKTIIRDSSYVRVPVLRKQREAKTLEQKAEEAANFIIKIRKRRFKLLAGQYEIFPEGDALAISVEELDKLEREYLELFLGKRIKQSFQQSFLISPESTNSTASYPFASFSSATGLGEAGSSSGNDLILIVDPAGKVRNLPVVDASEGKSNNLYYRVPDIADIKVKLVNEVLFEGRMPVYQAGSILNYPVPEEISK